MWGGTFEAGSAAKEMLKKYDNVGESTIITSP